jgi:hypothetical protein
VRIKTGGEMSSKVTIVKARSGLLSGGFNVSPSAARALT